MGCESQEPPYDFEWITPIPMPNGTAPSYWDILVDGCTGDIYCTAIERDPLNTTAYFLNNYRFDAEAGRLESTGSVSWPYSIYYHFDYTIFDARCYCFYLDYPSRDKLHLSLDGNTSDPLNITLPSSSIMRILATYGDDILLEVIWHDAGGYVFDLYSVDAYTLSWTKRTMFKYMSSSLSMPTSTFRHGTYYWTQYVENKTEVDPSLRYQTLLFTYELASAKTEGPVILSKEPGPRTGVWNYPYDVDTHGDIHMLDPDLSKLTRYSPAGDLLGEISMPPLTCGTVNLSVQWSDVLINGSDRVYLFGHPYTDYPYLFDGIVSLVVDREYTEAPHPRMLGSGPLFTYLMSKPVLNHTDTMFFLLVCHDETTHLGLTYQIPLTPDLTIDPRTYQLEETRGDPEPVMISFNVSNVGWAQSKSFVATVLERTNVSSAYSSLGDFSCVKALSRGEGVEFTMRTRLTHGAHWIRIVVHDVSPYENNRDNNMLEVLAFINVNNPPDLSVALPENGTVAEDVLLASGTSSDFDGDAPLVILVTGLPGLMQTAVGPGDWGLEIGLGDVPSGDYWLTFIASDGKDPSPPVHRLVRIDRPADSLSLRSFSPDGDVRLIVGDVAAFSIYVTERLSRPLSYTWTLDGPTVASGSPQHVFEAQKAGVYTLIVAVRSGLASMEHRWNISVRALTAPGIVPVSPGQSLTLGKRVEQEFRVSVDNPDEVPYEILWLSDGTLLSREQETGCQVGYARSGVHTVTALLRWGSGEATVSWNVTVPNTPPRLVSWSPNATITIFDETTIELSVVVEDDDGDGLDYRWEAPGLIIDPDGTGRLVLTCPYSPGVNRTVRVIASDGEDVASMTWSVVSPPETEPPPTEPHSTRPGVTWFLLVLILTVAITVTVGYYLGTRRRN